MARIKVEAILKSAASFSAAPALSNEVETLPYIPGSALRGMLAAEYLRSGKKAGSPEFRQIFGDDGVRFPNLYANEAVPLPRSAHTCKRYPGFARDRLVMDAPAHGVVDLLPADPRLAERVCPKCGSPLVPLEDRFYTGDPNDLKLVSVPTLVRMRTSVVSTGAARGGALFVQHELPADATRAFVGHLSGPASALAAFSQAFGAQAAAYGGRRRSGEIELTFADSDDPAAGRLHDRDGRPEPCAILTLLSDAILIDRLLRPVTALGPAEIQTALKPPAGAQIEVVRAFSASRRVAGWSGVGQMFKPDDAALAAGSTFLLGFTAGSRADIEQWMRDLTNDGIGLRRSEGFGRVTFADPLHALTFDHLGEIPAGKAGIPR